MLRLRITFPLGVYHARSATDDAEWPVSPLRVLAALLAAAHARPGAEPDVDRELLQRICEAPAPILSAPDSVAVGEQPDHDAVVRLHGVTRWAPRNYITGPVSPRNLGRDRAAVGKPGVAIGGRPVTIVWSGVELDASELQRIAILASEVTFVGTSRSPAIVEADAAEPADEMSTDLWKPSALVAGVPPDVTVRVPDPGTIKAFDRRNAARSSRRALERAGMVPELAVGAQIPYVSPRRHRTYVSTLDPQWWGEMIVLELDRDRSELIPRAAASYLLARAVRVALLGSFEDPGSPNEAPPILTGRGSEPHCAIMPLPIIWGPTGPLTGEIRGIAIVLPHESRVPDLAEQRIRVERGLRPLVSDESAVASRFVSIPGAGRIRLKLPDRSAAQLQSLREVSYQGPARSWVSITPVIHSRWRKSTATGLLDQVSADCRFVGLPDPSEVELLRGPGRRGGADKAPARSSVPPQWRSLLEGQASHLRISFQSPVRGPLLIGRARHFGLGLCVPLLDPGSGRTQP